MKQLERSKRPGVLGVKGESVAIVEGAEAYRRLDVAAHVDAEEGIREGLEDAKKGKIRPAKEFFGEFETENGIPR